MHRPGIRAGVRILACATAIVITGAFIAVSFINLRSTADLRAQVAALEASGRQRDARLESQVNDIPRMLDEISTEMRKDLALARRGSRGDVTRLGNNLNNSLSKLQGALDEMRGRLEDVPRGDAAQSASPQGVPPSLTAVPEKATRSAGEDLPLIRQLKNGKSFFESADYARARKSYHAALVLQPENPEATLYYAVSLYRSNPADADAFPGN